MMSSKIFEKESVLFGNKLTDLKLEIKSSMYLNLAWKLFWEHSGLFIPFTILFGVICLGLSFIPVIGQIFVGAIYPLMAAGYFVVSLKIIRGEKVVMSDFFKALELWYPLTISGLIGGILTALGCLALVLPGIYLYFAYLFSVQMIVDEHVGAWQSLEASRKIITKMFVAFTLFTLFSYLIVMAGILALGIGALVSFPMYFIMHAIAYDDIKKQIQHQI